MIQPSAWIRVDLDAAKRVVDESLQQGKAMSRSASGLVGGFAEAHVLYSPGVDVPGLELAVGHGMSFEIDSEAALALATSKADFVIVEDEIRVPTNEWVRPVGRLRPLSVGQDVYWVADAADIVTALRQSFGYPTNAFLMSGAPPHVFEDLDLGAQLVGLVVAVWVNESLLLLRN